MAVIQMPPTLLPPTTTIAMATVHVGQQQIALSAVHIGPLYLHTHTASGKCIEKEMRQANEKSSELKAYT